MERCAAMEVEDANPPWDAREREIIMKMESDLQRRERTLARLHELEMFDFVPVINLVSSLSRMKEGTPVFFLSTRSLGTNKWPIQRALPNRQGQKK